jgi:hypothetical protein
MASFPPIPPLPQLPFPLPFNFTIPPSHILTLPDAADEFCAECVSCFLDCLVTECVGRAGCDWVIVLNRKVYFIKWRDVTPRPPWTQQVWDIFKVLPPNCGCPSAPVSLGWQWCWADVIKTLRYDIFLHWQNGDLSGSGQTVVAIGTNAFQSATVGIPQIGPVLYLDASDSSTITLNVGAVEAWSDKSTYFNDAVQGTPANRPTVAAASLNGLDTIRFDAGFTQFLNVPTLKKRADWHLFVVGRFFTNAAWPRGTFFSATGFEDTYGGIEGKVYQDATIQPEGTPFSFLSPNDVPMVGTTLSSGTFGIWEFRESISSEGAISIGVNAFDQQVFAGNTANDFWDPTRQTFGEPIPLPAAVGRSNWGINPARMFDYLDGNVGQILLYPRVLSEGERTQVLNVLRAKWGLGAPLPFPPSP